MKDYTHMFSNVCSPSTHRRAQSATLRRNSDRQKSKPSAAQPLRSGSSARIAWTPDTPMHVHWVGGAEGWIRFTWSGGSLNVPGHAHVLDMLAWLRQTAR